KLREAETNFEKALAADPSHVRSIEALVEMATAAKEWMRALAHRKRLVAALGDGPRKAEALVRIADLLEQELRDPKNAAAALEQANAAFPEDAPILERLRATYEAMNRWAGVVDALGRLVEIAPTPEERAERRFQQADVTLGRLRDEGTGLPLLEAALE